MNRHQVSRTTALVGLGIFDHPGHEPHVDPPEEEARGWSVNFVCSGSFDVQHRRKGHRLGPQSVFITRPGFVYRCIHRELYPTDLCMTLDLAPELARESLGNRARAFTPFRPLSNHLGYLRFRLEQGLRAGASDLLLEEAALHLLAGLGQPTNAGCRGYQGHSLTWYARRIDRVRNLLESDYASPHSVAHLARAAGLSAFHFVRVFRDMVGVPPHRFLTQVRLAEATRLLREGQSVTETALACGYSDLSHFVRTFGKTYGVPPGRYARDRRIPAQAGTRQ